MFCGPGFDFMREELYSSKSNYLEIGIFNGDSIAQLAKEHPEHKFYGIDPFIEDGFTTHTTGVTRGNQITVQKNTALRLNRRLKNVKIFQQTSQQFLTDLDNTQLKKLNVGHVLIDGSHHYHDVVLDGILAVLLIGNKPGTIIFDDIGLPGVAKAHEEWIEANRLCISQSILLTPGIIVYRIN